MPIDLNFRSSRRRSSSQSYVNARGSPSARVAHSPLPQVVQGGSQSGILTREEFFAAQIQHQQRQRPVPIADAPRNQEHTPRHRNAYIVSDANMDDDDYEEEEDATTDSEDADGVSHAAGAAAAAAAAAYFQAKTVIALKCGYCRNIVTARAMRAILLADTKVELFSTDHPPVSAVQLVDEDYSTSNCSCKIRDVGCLGCGNVIGYHVTRPCQSCLSSCNNGHFWMFHSESVIPIERLDSSGKRVLLWECIGGPQTGRDVARMSFGVPDTTESVCR